MNKQTEQAWFGLVFSFFPRWLQDPSDHGGKESARGQPCTWMLPAESEGFFVPSGELPLALFMVFVT